MNSVNYRTLQSYVTLVECSKQSRFKPHMILPLCFTNNIEKEKVEQIPA